MRSLAALLLAVPALAACGSGGGPSIDDAVATKLARQADAIAGAASPCAARTHARILQRQTIGAINAGRIPADYLEPLQSRVNELAAELELRCLPVPAAEAPAPAPAPVPASGHRDDRGRGHAKHHDKHRKDK